jgi:hypothetical protein
MGIQQAFIDLPSEGAAEFLAELVRAHRYDDLIGALHSLKSWSLVTKINGAVEFHDLEQLRELEAGSIKRLVAETLLKPSEANQLVQVLLCETSDNIRSKLGDKAEETMQKLGKNDFWRVFEKRYPAFNDYIRRRTDRCRLLNEAGFQSLPDSRGVGMSDHQLEMLSSS